MRAGVHPVSDSGPVDSRRATAEPPGAFEHANRHPGPGQVAGDDGAVVTAADHHRVVSSVGHVINRRVCMKAAEYPAVTIVPELEL